MIRTDPSKCSINSVFHSRSKAASKTNSRAASRQNSRENSPMPVRYRPPVLWEVMNRKNKFYNDDGQTRRGKM